MSYSPDEMMAVAASRRLRDGMTCFVGIGLPSTAANLARRSHAPGCVLIYESGTIGAKPPHLPLSIGDGELAVEGVLHTLPLEQSWHQGAMKPPADKREGVQVVVIEHSDDILQNIERNDPVRHGEVHILLLNSRQTMRRWVQI